MQNCWSTPLRPQCGATFIPRLVFPKSCSFLSIGKESLTILCIFFSLNSNTPTLSTGGADGVHTVQGLMGPQTDSTPWPGIGQGVHTAYGRDTLVSVV